MKALSITQPWASLIALGEKHYETRSRSTRYRGPLAIHAAKGFTRAGVEFVEDWNRRIGRGWSTPLLNHPRSLPRGGVIAIVELVDVHRVEDLRTGVGVQELLAGDYTDGRFAWELKLIESFDLRPALGRQGLWEWDEAREKVAES